MTTEPSLIRVQEIIVVEGFHDKQAVDRAVTADVWVAGGDRVAHRFIEELRRAAVHRGVIILTDPDGPGERIRHRISSAIPGSKHAFVERRQALTAKGVGVEYANPHDIRDAILQARPELVSESPTSQPEFTMQDLIDAGLVQVADSAARRAAMGDFLHLGYANARSFLHKLNALGVSRDEWNAALRHLKGKQLNGN